MDESNLRKRLARLIPDGLQEENGFATKPVVVVVDDDDQVLQSLRVVLSGCFEVWATNDPVEGVTLATDEGVSVAIVDVRMPTRDGFWVFDEIRKVSSVPVVFNTAYQDARTIEEVERRVGEDCRMVKGTGVRELLALLRAKVKGNTKDARGP